ncbi:MAG: hypothetical protein HY821_24175, partial [Acidobacteria bacterium]|nr:hypothetical protein [Acidobacteriota bacterium]
MMKRIVLSLWLCAALLFGQGMKMSVAQLKNVLRSSIKLQHQDKQVADYVKKVTLTEKLTERDIEEMLGEGLGPKAADAMRSLVQASASLPAPVKDGPVKPPPPPMPPPSSEVQAQVIAEARELALSYTKRLPDFICLQVTRRYADPSGLEMYQLMDTVAARLSYFEQKEDYKLISVNG